MGLKRRTPGYRGHDQNISLRRSHSILFDLDCDRLAFREAALSLNVIRRIIDNQQICLIIFSTAALLVSISR
jgi:hypothetical protein